jgi:hypothetical protein
MRLPLPNNLFKEQQQVPVRTEAYQSTSGLSNPASHFRSHLSSKRPAGNLSYLGANLPFLTTLNYVV